MIDGPELKAEIEDLISQLDMDCDSPQLCREASSMLEYLEGVLIDRGVLPPHQAGEQSPMGVITMITADTSSAPSSDTAGSVDTGS